jgi:hypothetical protein
LRLCGVAWKMSSSVGQDYSSPQQGVGCQLQQPAGLVRFEVCQSTLKAVIQPKVESCTEQGTTAYG